MRYVQDPVGWWQDSKGQMQPPGSFVSTSLRARPEDLPASSLRGRLRRWTTDLLHRRP